MQLSGYDKAAIFLSSIGEDTASEVLKGLDVSDISQITMHMTRLRSVSKTVVDDVLKEVSEAMTRGTIHVGGEEFLQKVLFKGLGKDNATKILAMASKDGPLNELKGVDPRTLANFLVAEHPQTAALIICLLDAVQASEVFSLLPEKLQADVSLRIASTERIPESAVEELREVLKGQLDIGKRRGKKIDGTKTMAEILNHCDRTTEQMVLGKMEERNTILADSVRQHMFAFDDLVTVDNKGIQLILKEISSDDLVLALKTASGAFREKVFKNMPQRAGDVLKEEMQARGPAKVSDVERSQQTIVKLARRLEAAGKIVIAGRGREEIVE